MDVRRLSEENKTHNQVIISSPRSTFLDEMIVSNGVLPNATVILPQYSSLTFSDSLSSGGFTPLYSPSLFNPTVHLSTI